MLAFGDLLLFPRKRLGALELLSPELARNMALLSAAAFSSGVGGAPPEFSAASGLGCKLWVVPLALSGKPSTSPLVIGCSWCCQNGRPECAPVSGTKVWGGNPSGEWTGGTHAPLGSMAVAWQAAARAHASKAINALDMILFRLSVRQSVCTKQAGRGWRVRIPTRRDVFNHSPLKTQGKW